MKTYLLLIILLCTLSACQISQRLKGPEKLESCLAGEALYQDEAYQESIGHFERCIKHGNLRTATLIKTYRYLAVSYRLSGDNDTAMEYTDKIIQQAPEDIWNDYVNRGNLWADAGQYEKALEDFRIAQEAYPAFNQAFYNRGAVYERIGEYHLAREQFIKAWQHGLRSRDLYNRLRAYGLIQD